MQATSFLSIVRNDRTFLRRYLGTALGVLGFAALLGVGASFSYTISKENRVNQEISTAIGLQKAMSQQVASEILLIQKEWRDTSKLNERSFKSLSEASTAFDSVTKGFSSGQGQAFTYGGHTYTAPRLEDHNATLQKISSAWAPLRAQIDALGEVYGDSQAKLKNQSAREKFIAGRKTFITELHEDNKDKAFPNDMLGEKFVPTRRMVKPSDALMNAEITKTSTTLTTYKDELLSAVDALGAAVTVRTAEAARRNEAIQLGVAAGAAALLLLYFLRRTVVTDYVAHKEATEKRAIFGTIAEGLLVMDTNWKVTGEPSSFMTKIFGGQIVVGDSFADVLTKSLDADTMKRAIEFVALIQKKRNVKMSQLNDANPLKLVALSVPGAGTTKYVSFSFERLLDEHGRMDGLLVAVQDSTERQKLTSELALATAMNRDSLSALAALRKTSNVVPVRKFLDDLRRLLTSYNDRMREEGMHTRTMRGILRDLRSDVHKFKGAAGLNGVVVLQHMLHEFEDELIMLSNREQISAQAVQGDGKSLGQPILNMIEFIDSILPGETTTISAVQTPASIKASLANVAHQVAAEAGKKVQLVYTDDAITGSPTLKRLNGHLEGVLTQLVSNAVAHGIETPQARLERSKPEAGTISITGAPTPEGIQIVVKDDGAGFDVARIRQRARAMGVDLPDDAPDQQVVPLIFKHGFSTAAEASLGAGRGVGLNYVRDTVTKLGGHLSYGHCSGAGTQFVISFPGQ